MIHQLSEVQTFVYGEFIYGSDSFCGNAAVFFRCSGVFFISRCIPLLTLHITAHIRLITSSDLLGNISSNKSIFAKKNVSAQTSVSCITTVQLHRRKGLCEGLKMRYKK